MERGAADHDARRARRRRGVVLLVGGLVAAAAALRIALAFFAADLFAGVVQHLASQSGLNIAFEGEPAVSSSGFEARGVMLHDAAGARLLEAQSASGDVRFQLRSPFLVLSLRLAGASFAWPLQRGGAGEGALDVPRLPAIVSALVLENARVDLGGGRALAVDAAVESAAPGALAVSVSRIDYSEEAGQRAAEKISGTLRVSRADAAAQSGENTAGLRVELAIGSGAALDGALLLDFTAHPLSVSALVTRDAGRGVRVSDLALALGTLLRVSGRVDVGAGGELRTADLVASSDNLMPAFVALVREPFGGITPALADAALEGRGRVTLRLDSASRHGADATVSLSDVHLRARSVDAEGLDVEFPWIGAALSRAATRGGHLRAAKVTFLALPWTGVDTALSAAPGRVRATANQTWQTIGGTLQVADLVLEDDERGGPRVSASMRVEAFDLARLGEALGFPGLAGSLRGDLGRVRVDAEAIRADGALEVAALGGSLVVSKLSVEQPFSRVPSFGLDARASEIDLGALTGALGVGRISGVLEGQVSNLVIADGQPQSFEADFHSVDRSGVPRNVDVRAIVQLGVLGGGDSGSLTGSLLKLVDRYRYSKLGLRCRLHNDTFEIHGVESDKGRDYIVKGSLLPPSVSVVSHSQVVSFSEMLRRVRRIAAIGEGGSPNAATP